MSDFDLDAYCARIGYLGPLEPTLPVLRDLVAHHTAAIAFEALDVLAGRPVALDAAALSAKLIHSRRGGYCFEQSGLFQRALTAIGFRVTGLIARVRRGAPRDAMRPRTHMLLRVDLAGAAPGEAAWLADVGFGGLTPTAPLRLTLGLEQPTPHETYRLIPLGEEALLQARLGPTWEDIYQFGPAAQLPIDYELANWFTATHPASLFRNHVVATRPGPGVRHILSNWTLARRWPDGTADKQRLTGPDAFERALTEVFGLAVTGVEIDAVMATLARVSEGGADPFA